MRIMVLREFLCLPADSGKKVRTYSLVKHLAARHRFTLLTFSWGNPNERARIEHLASLGIKTVELRPSDSGKDGLVSCAKLFTIFFFLLPYIVENHLLAACREQLSSPAEKLKLDPLMAECSLFALNLDPLGRIKRVSIARNPERNVWRDYFEKSKSLA